MNDLERELREVLDEDARHAPPPRESRNAVRRTRRRQAAVVVLGALTVAAVVIGSITGLSAILGPSRSTSLVGGAESRTATVFGVGVTYPSSWTLVDLWPIVHSIATWPDPTSGTIDLPADIRDRGGVPVFQLSNHDLGLASACTGTAPTGDEAVLYVAVNGGPYLVNPDGSPKWSNDLTPGDGPCGQGMYAYREASTVYAARPYLVFAGFGPEVSQADRQAAMDAFASLSFAFSDFLLPPAEATPGYVLDAVRLGEYHYTLEARPASGGGVDLLLVNGLRPDANPVVLEGVGRPGDPDLRFVHSGLLRVGPADTCGKGISVVCWIVFGVASERVASVEVRLPSAGTFSAPILPLPASLGTTFGAFEVTVIEETGATMVALDDSGNVIAEEPLGQSEPIPTPTPIPSPAAEAQSTLRNALAAALTYFTDGNTFVGFDPATAEAIEPSITFNTSSVAREGEVSVRDVSKTTILLATHSSDGLLWCIADDTAAGSTTYGRVDAQTVAECDGDVSVWG